MHISSHLLVQRSSSCLLVQLSSSCLLVQHSSSCLLVQRSSSCLARNSSMFWSVAGYVCRLRVAAQFFLSEVLLTQYKLGEVVTREIFCCKVYKKMNHNETSVTSQKWQMSTTFNVLTAMYNHSLLNYSLMHWDINETHNKKYYVSTSGVQRNFHIVENNFKRLSGIVSVCELICIVLGTK